MNGRLEITTRCNLNCMHCGAAEYRTSREWTTEEALESFNDMISCGVTSFGFLGGEPFIRADILELLSYLDQRGIRSLITTNGLLLDEETIDFLADLKFLNGISFSIDGASRDVYETIRGKNTYEKMITNVQRLVAKKKEKKSPFSIGLTCVVNRLNAFESEALVELADENDLESVGFMSIVWSGNAKKNKDKLYADPETEFTACEKAARKVALVNRIRGLKGKHRMKFSIDNIPSTWKYAILQKYPLVNQVTGKFECQAGVGTLYVDASGVVYPCEAVKDHIKFIEEEIGEYERIFLPVSSLKDVLESESFRNAARYVKNKKRLFENVFPCGSCPFKDGCSFCPLHAQSEKVIARCSGKMTTILS